MTQGPYNNEGSLSADTNNFVTFLFKNSTLPSDRPGSGVLEIAEPAICAGAADPGLYILDSENNLLKVGPTAFGTNAPNSAPSGTAGNARGELWVDSSDASYKLRTWTGSSWVTIGAAGHAAVVEELQSDPLMISMIPEGTLVYQHTAPSGLYMRYSDGWVPV